VRRYRLGLGLLAALLLPTVALGYLSFQAVRSSSVETRLLLEQTHRSLADAVAAQIDARIHEIDRALIGQLEANRPTATELMRRALELGAAQPDIAPLIVLDPTGRLLFPTLGTAAGEVAMVEGRGEDAPEFETTLAAAEVAELRNSRPADAAALYAAAVELAPGARELTLALNGQARCELKVGRPRQALRAYETLVSAASPLDPVQASRSVIAHYQIVGCHRALGDAKAATEALLRFYEILIGHRFLVESDFHAFYRHQLHDLLAAGELAPDPTALAELSEREGRLEETGKFLTAISSMGPRLAFTGPAAGPAAPLRYVRTAEAAEIAVAEVEVGHREGAVRLLVAHPWPPAAVAALAREVLDEPGPWLSVGVVLTAPSGEDAFATTDAPPPERLAANTPPRTLPGWQVAVYPLVGSLDAVAAREVRRYAILLALVLGTVVAGLALGARSVSREVALARLRSDFVSSASHELKTPLTLIRLYADNLRAHVVGEERRDECYEVIARETERLTALINNMLDFARIEAGTQNYELTEVNLCQLARDIVDRYRFQLQKAEIVLVEELPREPVRVRADKDAIRQVVVNLLSNAVKYMREDERRISVRVAVNSDRAMLEITDTGIGIDERQLAHVFNRFARAEDPRVREIPGSGIGLTIVKHIVDAHGGEIRVRSAPDQGSTFTLTLPMVASKMP